MSDTERKSVVLAAFLHDVGKLLQRAGVQPDDQFDTDYWLQELCHRHRDHHTYRHAMLTAYFIDRFLPDPPEGLNKNSVFHQAAYHHRPHDDHWLDWVIVAADWIASGAERYDAIREEAHFRMVRLHPVFALIGLNGRQPDPADVRWDYPWSLWTLKTRSFSRRRPDATISPVASSACGKASGTTCNGFIGIPFRPTSMVCFT
ncbi:hypothetical protein HRbin11_02166 [bacterium HR11]|nr:hypothetical protein HRbin11_02166 [bacterium HR11]